MSLLLEALRKAERQAQRGAKDTEPGAHGPERGISASAAMEPNLTDELREYLRSEAPAGESEHRDVGDDSAPAGLVLELAERSAPRAALEPAAGSIAHDDARSAPAAARTIADPGLRGTNPRLPFYLVLGVLGTVAVAAIAYLWLQLQPSPQFASHQPARPAGEATIAMSEPLPAQLAIPGLPTAAPATAAEPAAVTSRRLPPTAARAASPSEPQSAAEADAAFQGRAEPLPVQRDPVRIHAQVESGYAAFQGGDTDAARAAYRQALREEPDNRDAMLGMAAVETRARRFDLAEAHYLRLLQMHPRDPYAQAGLLALRTERVDPLQAESSLKTLLAADPDATALYFSLGNQFARQGRWAEAQQAYFQALAGDAGNPDVAFNLAVSLDRLHQTAPAAEYYERALKLAERRVATFSAEAARLRLQQLGR